MVRLGLDDTLHAIVQVTHEHGLPLTGVSAQTGGYVQVFTAPVDLPWWVRWLADPLVVKSRFAVWVRDDGDVTLHVCGDREGIEWSVVDRVPAATAVPLLAAHGVTATSEHLPVAGAVAVALAEARADLETGPGGSGSVGR